MKHKQNPLHHILLLLLLLTISTSTSTAKKAPPAAKNVIPPPPSSPSAAAEKPKPTRQLSSIDLALAGAVATMIGDASMHPIDCIKTLQQSNEGAGLNMLAAGRQIFKNGGVGGFYSGMGTYVVSDGGAGAFKFATYEALKHWIKDKIPEEYYGAALFSCAAVAFIASSVILVPGELLKQRLQMGQISSVSQGVRKIWAEEGLLGFYAGYSGVCLRDVPYTMLELGIYDNLKSLYLTFKNRDNTEGAEERKITQFDEIIAAAITGAITGYLTVPFDTIKTKLMLDSAKYTGFGDALRQTVASGGIMSVFQGGAARVSWLVPFTAIYLPVYEIFKRRLSEMYIPVDQPVLVDSSHKQALAVKGGECQRRRVFGVNGNRSARGKQFLDRTDSFV